MVAHVADGSTPWCTLEWLDPTFGYLSRKSSSRFSYSEGVPLDSEGRLGADGVKIVSYQLDSNHGKKKSLDFSDIFMFIDHLLFTENIIEHETIRRLVTDCRVVKEIHTMKQFKKASLQALMAPPELGELPAGYSESNRSDLEQTLLEMANYATKCITEDYIYIDEHMNLDMNDMLPRDIALEPSTDHTSSKKKEKRFGMTFDDVCAAPARDLSKSGDLDLSNLQLVEQKDDINNRGSKIDVKRKLMNTEGPSPDSISRRPLNFGEENTPKQREFEKYLGKRHMEAKLSPLIPMEITKMSNQKPSYKSRNASPPRAAKRVIIDRNHPFSKHIDMAKIPNEKKNLDKINGFGPEKNANTIENGLNKKVQPNTLKEEPSTVTTKGINPVASSLSVLKEQQIPIASSKPGQNPHHIQMPNRVMAPSAPRVKESCEKRTELTAWPAQTAAQNSKPERPSMFANKPDGKEKGFSRQLIEKFMQQGVLRNMSGPPTRAGERISK